jgi:hypothetical protein
MRDLRPSSSRDSLTRINTLRNPTIEDQALARIHRIGQTQEVTTVRFYVRDSFEEASNGRPDNDA